MLGDMIEDLDVPETVRLAAADFMEEGRELRARITAGWNGKSVAREVCTLLNRLQELSTRTLGPDHEQVDWGISRCDELLVKVLGCTTPDRKRERYYLTAGNTRFHFWRAECWEFHVS